MARKKTVVAGYKKRLARRLSGNPGPRQQWVPAYLVSWRGETMPNPLAAKRLSAAELTAMRREDDANVEEGGSL